MQLSFTQVLACSVDYFHPGLDALHALRSLWASCQDGWARFFVRCAIAEVALLVALNGFDCREVVIRDLRVFEMFERRCSVFDCKELLRPIHFGLDKARVHPNSIGAPRSVEVSCIHLRWVHRCAHLYRRLLSRVLTLDRVLLCLDCFLRVISYLYFAVNWLMGCRRLLQLNRDQVFASVSCYFFLISIDNFFDFSSQKTLVSLWTLLSEDKRRLSIRTTINNLKFVIIPILSEVFVNYTRGDNQVFDVKANVKFRCWF